MRVSLEISVAVADALANAEGNRVRGKSRDVVPNGTSALPAGVKEHGTLAVGSPGTWEIRRSVVVVGRRAAKRAKSTASSGRRKSEAAVVATSWGNLPEEPRGAKGGAGQGTRWRER